MLFVKYVFHILTYVIFFQTNGMSKAAENVPAEIEYMPESTLVYDIVHAFDSMYVIKPTDVKFYAFLADRPTESLVAETVKYDRMKKVAFYTHGFKTPLLDDSVSMKDAIYDGTDDYDCVVLVDWRKGSFANDSTWFIWKNYKTAAIENVPTVGELLAQFIDKHITNIHTYVHLIGHSLGGQISGIAARTVTKNNPRRVLNRLSAIDPAGPIFEYSLGGFFPIITKHTLRKTDANFVDVIHASTNLGMVKEAGHVDTYIDEVDCWLPTCIHSKAVEVFQASINKCSQITCPYGKLSNNKCEFNSHNELSSVGILTNMYDSIGKYTARFYTSGFWWWKTSTHECTALLNEKLKAKERICKPPFPNSKCVRNPYQTMCEEINKICIAAGIGGPDDPKVIWK